MQINNIAITANKCKKPCVFKSFTGNENCSSERKKVRYKHYEEMSNDALKARSIIKAHQDAQNSAKMHLYKAIPTITSGIIATSLAITRPGKLSAKAATGLGFLATMAGLTALGDILVSSDKSKRKNAYATLGSIATVGAGAAMMAKGAGKGSKVADFFTKEANQLSKEINATKLARLSNEYVEPFIKKHPKFTAFVPFITAISTSVLGGLSSVGLLKGLSQDIKKNACDNFEKGKAIQNIAKEHFDSIDAIEV